jgi:hypothetical protein
MILKMDGKLGSSTDLLAGEIELFFGMDARRVDAVSNHPFEWVDILKLCSINAITTRETMACAEFQLKIN